MKKILSSIVTGLVLLNVGFVHADTYDDVTLTRVNNSALVDSQDAQTPNYTIEFKVNHGKFAGKISEDDITYTDGFAKAVTTSIQQIDDQQVIVHFKKDAAKIKGSDLDGYLKINKQALLDANGQQYYEGVKIMLHDDFIPKIIYDNTGDNTQPTSNNLLAADGKTMARAIMTEVAKNIGEFGKEFAKCPAMKCLVFGDTFFQAVNMIMDLINSGQPEHDPYKEKLDQISQQIDVVTDQLNTSMELSSDQAQKQELQAAKTGLSKAKEQMFSESNLNRLYAVAAVMQQDAKQTLSQSDADLNDQVLQKLYSSGSVDDNGKLIEGNYTFINDFKQFALQVTGEYGDQSTGNIFSVEEAIENLSHNFNSETFNDRKNYNGQIEAWYELVSAPLMYAVNYDLNKNLGLLETYQARQAELEKLKKENLDPVDDDNVKTQLDAIGTRITHVGDNIRKDKDYIGYKNSKALRAPELSDSQIEATSSLSGQSIILLNNAKITTEYDKAATEKLNNEQDDWKNGKIYAYRLGRQINRAIGFENISNFALMSLEHSNETIDNVNYSKRMATGEIRKLRDAALTYFRPGSKTAHTNLFEELEAAGFKSTWTNKTVKAADLTSGTYTFNLNDAKSNDLQNYTWGFYRLKREWTTTILEVDAQHEKNIVVFHKESGVYSSKWDSSKDSRDNKESYFFLNL
ncbi:MAG: hypothetical protein LBT80_00380 [Lactobacillaceae bacterium]|jgi:hypothetical protein|nr:hypothetical protein [Lactobacillaceae bacterium]